MKGSQRKVKFPDPQYVLNKGRYKGCKIQDLPEEYLEWMWDTHHWGWTINEIEDIDEMIRLGVDAIITDFPERVKR